MNDINDNKTFSKLTKPLFGDKGGYKDNIVLVEDDKIISDDAEVAQAFNKYFQSTVKSLDIADNRCLLTETKSELNIVDRAIGKYENHPSILNISEKVKIEDRFSFLKVNADDIKLEIKRLNKKKTGPFMNIPAKHLKQTMDILFVSRLCTFGIRK